MKPTIRRFSFFLLASLAALALAAPLAASTVAIVTDTTPGYYNSSIGNLLNSTTPGSPFPDGTDPSLDFPSPPNLTPAQSVLGGWLQNPPTLNSPNWSSTPVTVPLQWAVGTETAIVYRVEVPASGYTGVTMRFGVDNGIFVWLDGVYRGGFIRPGPAIPGEHTFNVGNLSAGTHYIQVLREDHSITNEYTVEITGQAPGPEMNLTGNGTNILDGDNSPRPADHTDFGTAPAGSGTVVRTFTIQNTGQLPLLLTGTPLVAVSGLNAADFTVTQQPDPSVAVGLSKTFQVTFTPPALGNSNATLTIVSDDGDENPYDFAITGTGSGALNAIYNTGAEVPLSTDGFTATGSTVNFTLNYPPVTGTELMVVKNTGIGFISGNFDNLAQGQTVTLSHAGSIYQFVANYYGGSGNDLVLVWKKNRVFGWGYNTHGELGDATTLQRNAPVPVYSIGVLAGKTVVSVATGLTHSLALCSDGTVAAWGSNNEGQLGDNTLVTRVVPVAVNRASGVSALFGKTVVAVAAGGGFSVALCSDGTVATWGGNTVGALGDNTTISRRAPVAVNTALGISALFGKTVVNIASGADHTLALCSDGTLTAWGWNQWGQNGDNTTTQRRVPVVVNATSVLSALRGRSVVAIACGGTHSLALCSDGTLTAWGYNGIGELGDTTATLPGSSTLLLL